MTFETVSGLNGKENTVSFKNVSTGTYLTSAGGNLTMSDGSDAEACSFNVTNRAALSSISAQKTTTSYEPGATLDVSDLVVTANRKDGTSEVITDYTTNAASISLAAEGKKNLVITYREDNFLRTANVELTVAKKAEPVKEVKVSKISLNASATLTVGKTLTLNPTIIPGNATNKTLKYTSANTKCAVVSDKGVITAKKAGSTTITVAATDGSNAKATIKVTVKAKTIKSTKVKLNKKKVTLKKGKSITLRATMTPKNSTDKLQWSSSKKKVAKVTSKGKVTAKKKGKAVITVKTSSGKKAKCTVVVK